MYADDLAIDTNHLGELQGALEAWKELFKKHGLNTNPEKTELMWVGKQREEVNIWLEEKAIKQVNIVVYLGGNICDNGRVGMYVVGATQDTNRSEMHGGK